ncbi:glycoside hydrolase family 10 protein [Natronincola peptidivorans]|uniref:glycoside hydrolase family 10 protein n=1 Tax=Natronincola peptidivorans TaxID=426128 RepID=UPI001FCA6AEC|nr:family 10 glycosylhydrolase [Natronincola peptidivorans]
MKKRMICVLGVFIVCAVMLFISNIPAYGEPESLQEDSYTMDPLGIDENVEEIEEGEFRAAWVTTVYNLDWPSKKGLSKEEQQKEFTTLLDQLQEVGLNAVIVQVKPTADSFYPSEYGPWSEYLTGIQGKDPAYDPLAFMIEATHQRNMEFHAWFNPFRVSVQGDINALAKTHPARINPTWVVPYRGQLYYNPGMPEVRSFVRDSIMEVVEKYPVDGVHLDDYFYPYPAKDLDFPDDALYKISKRYPMETKEEWRRSNVNEFIQDLYTSIKNENMQVKFGVSPFAIWRNQSDDPLGSATRGGVTSYDGLYADTKLWVEEGWLDYIAPQIYWYFGYGPAAYEIVLHWWSNLVQDRDIHLYVGHAAYKAQPEETPWGNPYEILNQIDYNRNAGNAQGSIFFRAQSIVSNPLNLGHLLKTTVYKDAVSVPEMPWLQRPEELLEEVMEY